MSPTAESIRIQKEIWNQEQHAVASFVQVEPDPPIDTSVVGDNPLFQFIREEFQTTAEYFGGVDVSFPASNDQLSVAVYVIIDKRTMQVVYEAHEFFELDIPYIPTYLAFREIQPLEALVQQQVETQPELTPQAILVDGNGILHPRHAGIACFLGTRLNIPTIGIGKSLLYEGGWTRENLAECLDQFAKDVHCTIGKSPQSLKSQMQECRGVILKNTGQLERLHTNTNNSSEHVHSTTAVSKTEDGNIGEDCSLSDSQMRKFDGTEISVRKRILQDLASYCNGLAIPLTVSSRSSNDDDTSEAHRFPVLGAAMIGQGGKIGQSSRSKSASGSCKEIFVSVGHKISLTRAVQATASLCLARIPEPVRQADLIGRQLQQQAAESKEQSRVASLNS